MFGGEYRIPIDIMFDITKTNKTFDSIEQYEQKFNNLCTLARDNMKAKQLAAATYYDKKTRDSKLNKNDNVMILLPRNVNKKLKFKWDGPYKITNVQHPSYEIEITKHNGNILQWLTRDKLKLAPKNIPLKTSMDNEIKRTVEPEQPDMSSSDSDNEERDVRESRQYNLRRNINIPNRYGEIYTHCSNILF